MTVLYRVSTPNTLHFSDSLHWANFYPDKQRHHNGVMSKRQDLILYLANIHAAACRSGMPLGMIHIPMRLSSLRKWVNDYRIVLDYFFDVIKLGFNLGGSDHEISTLIPKNITNGARAASETAYKLQYVVPPRPDGAVVSKVYIQQAAAEQILKKLAATGRLDLKAAVEWLLQHPEVNFHFVRSGKLQMRDTSVWPVKAIETWPSWLREALFGPGIDIDSAYTQFLVMQLNDIYKDRPELPNIMFPDILRSVSDKKAWREELCKDILGLEINDDNIGIVKKVCMSLANGSNISPAILLGRNSFSVTADIIIDVTEDVSVLNLKKIGERLQNISKQYSNAKKMICSSVLRTSLSRANQKKVFSSYFEWEREARYAIWNACDQHGIMIHDGIDGIPEEYLKNLPSIIRDIGIKLTRT